jgi:hypothetical protein
MHVAKAVPLAVPAPNRLKGFRAEKPGSKARCFMRARPNKPLERSAYPAGFFRLLRYRRG